MAITITDGSEYDRRLNVGSESVNLLMNRIYCYMFLKVVYISEGEQRENGDKGLKSFGNIGAISMTII